jgi:hypothetical protein
MNEDVERFLDECRADAFFQNNPNGGVDRIEDLLTKFYHEADESPAWQELWDRRRGIITGKAPLIEDLRSYFCCSKRPLVEPARNAGPSVPTRGRTGRAAGGETLTGVQWR